MPESSSSSSVGIVAVVIGMVRPPVRLISVLDLGGETRANLHEEREAGHALSDGPADDRLMWEPGVSLRAVNNGVSWDCGLTGLGLLSAVDGACHL
jgi:hypothetical protein